MLKRILNKHFLNRLAPVIGGGSRILPPARSITAPVNVPGSILNKYRAFLSRLYFRKAADRWRFSDLAMEFALPFIIMKKGSSPVTQKIIRQSTSLAYIFKNYLGPDRSVEYGAKTVSPQPGEIGKPFFANHPLFADAFRQVVYKNIGMRVIERSQQSIQTLAGGGSKSGSGTEYESPGANLQFRTPAQPAAIGTVEYLPSERVNIPGAAPSHSGASGGAFLQPALLPPFREGASTPSPVILRYQQFNRSISGNRMPENLRRNSFQYPAPGSLLTSLAQNPQPLLKFVTGKFNRGKNADLALKLAQSRTLPQAGAASSESLHPGQNISFEKTTVLTHKISEKQDTGETASAAQGQRPMDSTMIPGHPANQSAETLYAPIDAEPGIKLARPLGISDPRAPMANGDAEVSRIADAVYTLIEKKLRVERERRGIFF